MQNANRMRLLTAPFDLCEADILPLFAGFDGVQAFISIALLICANVTLQGVAYEQKHYWEKWKEGDSRISITYRKMRRR